MGRETALRRIAGLAPGAVVAANDRFRSFARPSGRRGESGRPVSHQLSCASDTVIGMIDTRVDGAHPALSGARIIRLTTRAPDRPESSAGHGTAVASMLVGRRGGAAPGLAPEARLVAVDAFHTGGGGDMTDAFDLARAIDLLATQDVRIINMSLTGPQNAVLGAAVAAIQSRGSIVVAAAGNDGPRAKPLYPAAYPGVVAVAAVEATGTPWRRSARGDHIAFSAEGVGIALAGRAGGAEPHSGTSFAAPVVSAMLAGEQARAGGGADWEAITRRLADMAEDGGEPGRDPVFGHGIVRPERGCR
jgi:subtilisin family serine protease